MKQTSGLNESSIFQRSEELSQFSDIEIFREIYHRSQTDHVSSNANSISYIGKNHSIQLFFPNIIINNTIFFFYSPLVLF